MEIRETLSILLYALAGGVGALSLLIFIVGLTIYFLRIGTERRLRGIQIMQHGVSLILACFLLIALIRFVEWWG